MKLAIKTWREGNEVKIQALYDVIGKEEPNLKEVSLAIWQLERFKKDLLELEFESEAEIIEEIEEEE